MRIQPLKGNDGSAAGNDNSAPQGKHGGNGVTGDGGWVTTVAATAIRPSKATAMGSATCTMRAIGGGNSRVGAPQVNGSGSDARGFSPSGRQQAGSW